MTTNKSINPNVFRANFARGQQVIVSDELHPSFNQQGRITNISPSQAICVEFVGSESARRVWFHSNQITTNQNPSSSAARGNV
ncbi:MAG: hypothetical protein RM368_37170 [Nostoc sp. DedSLP03]|nr:hypothetical protein [Nostoc sp. DedSLP03]